MGENTCVNVDTCVYVGKGTDEKVEGVGDVNVQ